MAIVNLFQVFDWNGGFLFAIALGAALEAGFRTASEVDQGVDGVIHFFRDEVEPFLVDQFFSYGLLFLDDEVLHENISN